MPGRDHVVVLIGHNLTNANAFEPVPGEPGVFRAVPLFNDPGTVHLTLASAEGLLGTRVVTVVAADSEARAALELLYPRVGPNRPHDPDGINWMSLLINGRFSRKEPIDDRTWRRIDKEFAVIQQHPDWREIYEALVARLGAWTALRATSAELERVGSAGALGAELDPVAQRVARAIDAEFKSPYAQVVQDAVRGLLAERERLLARAKSRSD